jgi:hypothetical protein
MIVIRVLLSALLLVPAAPICAQMALMSLHCAAYVIVQVADKANAAVAQRCAKSKRSTCFPSRQRDSV